MPPGQAFKPGRNIDPVTEDVAVLDEDVALVDADAELDAFICNCRRIALGHAALDLSRTTQRIHHAAELNEQAVACRLHEAAVVRGNRRIEQFSSNDPKP